MTSFLLYYVNKVCTQITEYKDTKEGSRKLQDLLHENLGKKDPIFLLMYCLSREDLELEPSCRLGGILDVKHDPIIDDIDDY